MRNAIAAASFASLVLWAGLAAAQGPQPAPAQSQRGARMIERMCGAPVKPQSARYAERLSDKLSLTDAQKALLKDWQDARQKSREDTRAALCAQKPDFTTFAGRMAWREKRLETQLAGFRATRPKIEAFYASLDDRQKANWDDMRDRRDERRQRRRFERN